MKIGTLLKAQDSLGKAVEVEIDGKRALKLRKIKRAIEAELQNFTEMRDDFIKKHGVDGAMKPENPKFNDLIKLLNEVQEEEVEIEIEPVLKVDDFEKVSTKVLDDLMDIGLLTEGEDV